uniref:VWFA domain-containing protein n=1 Tax=Panagrolaimus sp. ES5 TaxID=591445 RepID=A0AC34G1G1_9BILA
MKSALDAAEQTSIPYSLLQQFSSLATNFANLNNSIDPFGVLIFISDTSDAALNNADRLLSKLKGIRLTFVLLGNSVDSSKLQKFSTNFLFWPDLTQPQPDNWDLLSYHTYGCDIQSVSTTSAATTSSVAADLYYPCQNWITVLVDNSNELTSFQFKEQLNFTKKFLNQVTHPDRIRFGSYNEFEGNLLYPWDPNNDQQGLQKIIDEIALTTSNANILKAIQLLVAAKNTNQTSPDSTLIFVTDTSSSIQIQQAINLYNTDLKPKGIKLTFIFAGNNANANALQVFDDAIFFNWQNIGFFPQPDRWDLSKALRCSQKPVTTTIAPYVPCQSWIHFGVDDSNTLNNFEFATQLNFISSAIGALNHPERIQVLSVYKDIIDWNNAFSIEQIQMTLRALPQNGPYSLRKQFYKLSTSLSNIQPTSNPVGAILFISDTSDDALAGADFFMADLQNIRLTFVMLGKNVDSAKLSKFSNNIISWTDLSMPQPDNWKAIPQNGPYSLRKQFYKLSTSLSNIQPTSNPVGAIIFISDTSDDALAGADFFMEGLQNIRLTFILLGKNVDSAKLSKFSNNTISWTDLSVPQPDNWKSLFFNAYGCQ